MATAEKAFKGNTGSPASDEQITPKKKEEETPMANSKRLTAKIGLKIHPKLINTYKKLAIDDNTSFSEIVEALLLDNLKDRGIHLDL